MKPLRETTIAVPPQPPKIAVKRKAEDADASKDLKKVRFTVHIHTRNFFGLDREKKKEEEGKSHFARAPINANEYFERMCNY